MLVMLENPRANPFQEFQGRQKVMADDGMLLIWTPDMEWIEDAAEKSLITQAWKRALMVGVGDDDYDRHRDLFTREDLGRMLIVAGFRVRSMKEVGGSIECVAFKVGDE